MTGEVGETEGKSVMDIEVKDKSTMAGEARGRNAMVGGRRQEYDDRRG